MDWRQDRIKVQAQGRTQIAGDRTMQDFPHHLAGHGHLPPLGAVGWFVDARCLSHRPSPVSEEPEIPAIPTWSGKADAVRGSVLGAGVCHLLVQWFRGAHSMDRGIAAGRSAEAR